MAGVDTWWPIPKKVPPLHPGYCGAYMLHILVTRLALSFNYSELALSNVVWVSTMIAVSLFSNLLQSPERVGLMGALYCTLHVLDICKFIIDLGDLEDDTREIDPRNRVRFSYPSRKQYNALVERYKSCSICLVDFPRHPVRPSIFSFSLQSKFDAYAYKHNVVCYTPRCEHPFHIRCIKEWLHSSDDKRTAHCPYCRTSLYDILDDNSSEEEEEGVET